MISYQITTAALAVCIVVTILVLIRKDLLHTRYGVWWFAIAGGVLVLGFFPTLVDVVAAYLGVTYPPTLIITVGIGFLLIKMLTMDLERSRQERKLRRFAQRLAMYEAQKGLPGDNDLPPEEPSGGTGRP